MTKYDDKQYMVETVIDLIYEHTRYWHNSDEYEPIWFVDVKTYINNYLYEMFKDDEDEKPVYPTDGDVYALMEIIKIMGIVSGSKGENYRLNSDIEVYDIDYSILTIDEAIELEKTLDDFDPKVCTVREWFNRKAPAIMAKAAKRTAIYEAKLAKAKAKEEERGYWAGSEE